MHDRGTSRFLHDISPNFTWKFGEKSDGAPRFLYVKKSSITGSTDDRFYFFYIFYFSKKNIKIKKINSLVHAEELLKNP